MAIMGSRSPSGQILLLALLLGSVSGGPLGVEAGPRPRGRPAYRRHIRERGRETWELRGFLGRDPITRRDRYKSRTFKGGKKDAERELRSLLSSVEAGVVSEGTSGDLLERWYLVASTSRDWSPKTVAEHRRIIDKQLGPLSGRALNYCLDRQRLRFATSPLSTSDERRTPSRC